MLPPSVIEVPLREAPKTMYFDLRVYEAGRKLHRNVLMARNAVVPPANFITEQSRRIVRPVLPSLVTSHTFQGTEGNTVTIMTASAPLRVRLTLISGNLDLGLHTLFVFTANIITMVLENEDAATDVDVEIIHA